MDGWKRFQRLARVKCPSASWNAPTMRNPVGRIRNIRAKMKKGTTPSQAQDMRPRDMRPGSLGAADTAGILPTLVTIAATARQGHAAEEVVPPSAPCGRACRARPRGKRRLLHVRPDHGIPLLRDDALRLVLLVEGREDGFLVRCGRRQF